ncbi:histone deacetylase [Streptomyces odontomachi]|uniref:histone deacetylase n=1 Tax=Streptomyces odontomachi TaxID=2944940 RepID=UPI00210BC54C|nr:histone deacetylase [Streptomyces sp. ODS25]
MKSPVPVEPVPPAGLASGASDPDVIWYVSYGSNMRLDRLALYIRGGRLPGTDTVYPGCRDHRMPQRSIPVTLRGAVYFATWSPVWKGARAFYDPEAPGRTLARAHLISVAQFSDIVAQEMYREPEPEPEPEADAEAESGGRLDLSGALAHGRAALGDGRYETLVCPGHVAGVPAVTFTAPWRMSDVTWRPPSAAYLRHLASGLAEAGPWDVDAVAAYLVACPGAGHWTAPEVAELIRRDQPVSDG